MNQLIVEGLIRLIAHRQIEPGLFVYDAFIMGKGIKAVLTVVSAHPAFSEAAEAHFAGGQVDDGIIDAAAAKAAGGGYFFCIGLASGEDIKRQGMLPAVDRLDRLIEAVIGENRQQRAENFLLHDRVGKGNAI